MARLGFEAALWGSCLLVGGSSILGLGVPMSLGGFDILVSVWSASALADGVFIAGTVLAGVFGYLATDRYHPMLGIVGGAPLHWVTYAWSWSLAVGEMESFDIGTGVWTWVFRWGWPGLAFATFAPVAFWAWFRPAREPVFPLPPAP